MTLRVSVKVSWTCRQFAQGPLTSASLVSCMCDCVLLVQEDIGEKVNGRQQNKGSYKEKEKSQAAEVLGQVVGDF